MSGARNNAWAVTSIILLYAAAANTFLARFAGTCTQGDAERLFGIFPSGILFLIALICMIKGNVNRVFIFAIFPFIPFLVWLIWFSAQLSFGIFVLGYSACEVLEGSPPPYPMSGSETLFAVSWPAIYLGVLLGLLALWSRFRKMT